MSTGQLFQGCIECEMRGGYAGGGPSNTQAMLFNVRYALSYCLFGYPANQQLVNSPCVTSKACGPFRNAIMYGNLSAEHASYACCQRWPTGNDVDYRSYGECLQAAENYYLANFVTVLQAGCEQQPAPGAKVGIQGSVFSTDKVSITTPSPTATVDPAWFDRGPLNLGAKVAISVAGFVLVLVGLGYGVVFNGKRRRRAYLRRLEAQCAQAGWPSFGQQQQQQQQPEPQSAWEDSPLTAVGSPEKPYGTYPPYLSPYSSQHSSPVSAHGAASPSTHLPPTAAPTALGIIHPGEDLESRLRHTRPHQAEAEAFEMHQVDVAKAGASVSRRAEAPVLAHPGYGRPRQYAPAEAHAKVCNAI